MQLNILQVHRFAKLPAYKTTGAAMFDLHAVIDGNEDSHVVVAHGMPVIVRTGLKFEIPEGYAMKIYSRSGHGFNKDTRLANCVGIIDSDYRGEVLIKLTNDNQQGEVMVITNGDSIAQAEIVPVLRVEDFNMVSELSETERGEGGFGHTDNQQVQEEPTTETKPKRSRKKKEA